MKTIYDLEDEVQAALELLAEEYRNEHKLSDIEILNCFESVIENWI